LIAVNTLLLKIPVVADLPVGQTMQDHVFTIVGPFVKSPVLNIDEAMSVENAYNYFANGTGEENFKLIFTKFRVKAKVLFVF